MKTGERFTVELVSNPGAGQGWSYAPDSAVVLVSKRNVSLAPPNAGPGFVGANERTIFEFEALKSTTLHFKKTFIGKEVLETKDVPVRIDGEGNPLAAFALVALGGAGLWWAWKKYG